MTPFHHILCPVDESPSALRGLQYGGALARQFGAELAIMTVRESAPMLVSRGDFPAAEGHVELESSLAALRNFAQQALGAAPFEVSIHQGDVVDEIERAANDWPADLIVMGTHGPSAIERLTLGSTTERVLRRIRIPMLVVPRYATDQSVSQGPGVLAAFDRSPASERALTYAAAWASNTGSPLVVLHVVDHVIDEAPQFTGHFDNESCFRALEPELRQWYASRIAAATSGCAVTLALTCGRASQEILAAAAEHKAGLIVVGAASAPALFGSTAHDILRQAAMPVLVVPAPSS